MEVKIPRRKFNIDIDGKVFEAKELSVAYFMEAQEDPLKDTADLAIEDSMGVIPDEDLKYFGIETKNLIYSEIIKFTLSEVFTAEDLKHASTELNLSVKELNALDRSAKVQIKAILGNRKPRNKVDEKKV